MGRNPNGRSSVYQNAEGWHGRVTVGVKDNGKPDRRHVTREDKDRSNSKGPSARKAAGRRPRAEAWSALARCSMAHVLGTEHRGPAERFGKHPFRLQRGCARSPHPGLGAHWLDKLEPEHLENLYAKMQRNGSSAGTAHHVHRTIRNALNEAVRRGHLARNPVLLAKAPKLDG